MARITPDELGALIDAGNGPLILDVRIEDDRNRSGWIPGAVFATTPEDAHPPPNGEVVVYCDCPNEMSAAILARALHARGLRKVRPLAGGFAAWLADGRPVEGVQALR
jgi:rhodanese-related sulfurtransferase